MRKNDNDLLRFHGDAASTAVEDAAVNYQSPSIIAAGADAHGVSILATLFNFSLALVCLKAPSLIQKAGLEKRGAIILTFLNILTWVPLALVFLISRLGTMPTLIALLWFINVVPGMLLSLQRDNWMSNIVPRSELGRYLGQRLAIKSAFYLGAFFLLGYILDKFGKDNIAGFTIIFTIAVVVVLVDLIIFSFMSEKKVGEVPPPTPVAVKFSLSQYFAELKEMKLNTFVIFTAFFYLTVGLSGPFYAIYMLNELHFTYMSYTVVISAEFIARVISAPLWGRYADKAGNIRILSIVTRIIPIVPILWLFCHNLGYLVLIQLISGTCWGAFDLCNQSYIYKVAPQPKKLNYIVYTRFLTLLCMALGGLAGAFCVSDIFPTFGSRILSVFWLSGITRAIVVLIMMPKLVDMAMSFAKPPSPPEVNLETLGRVMQSKHGRFYYRGQQAEAAVAQIQNIKNEATSKLGLHTGSRKWVIPEKPMPVITGPVIVAKAEDINRRLEHYRTAMAALADMKPAISHHELKDNEERLNSRYHLNQHQPESLVAAHAIISESLIHHEIKQNEERLKLRFSLDFPAHKSEPIEHHEIEQNIERLKLRFKPERQLEPSVAFAGYSPVKLSSELNGASEIKSGSGLFRDKTGWASYMKNTLDAVMKDLHDQPVPVTVHTMNPAAFSPVRRSRETSPNRYDYSHGHRSPVLA